MNNFRIGICIVLLAAVFSSCTKPDISFGADYLDNNYTNIVIIDTATVAVSTVRLDSFATSNSGKALIANYKDPYFGTVTSEAYFPLTPPSYATDSYLNTSFDSLELIIKPDKTFTGDTTQPLSIIVHQLASQITYAENKTSIYNLNTVPVTSTPLGSRSLVIRPSVTDTIAIRLSNEVGLDLLTRLQTNDDVIQTSLKFIDHFKGIRVSAGNNSFALGFSDSVVMRLHYKQQGIVQQSKYADFTLADAGLQFNHTTVERAGTALANLSPGNKEISSSQTNNAGYLQTGTGSIVKLRFPFIRDFLAASNFLKIEKAELVVKPVNNTFNGLYPLPPQLRLSETTQDNGLGADLVTSATAGAAVQYGDLVIDNLYGENTAYTYDVTTYVDSLIANPAINQNGLLISPPSPSFQSNFSRAVIGDRSNTNGGVKLRLYYLTVNPN